ncbi:MFS transporter [Pseudomonas sp. PSKL.D1]|uniref:MFS transporter n=1 Tax=Pseudomonas sp. PSKL.D1 TaxID=3029060 RepID=UPI00238102D4|nr:MFS transporter [Pseudomonas sp. PSKL.D1]WDY60450.1 MFS transporter [Pseudomonas sp. PSKL.D1]
MNRVQAGWALIAGIVLATLTEAITSSVLALARNDIIGDTAATPDEFAWLDVSYIACKLTGFLLAPWLLGRLGPRNLLLSATALMGVACLAATLSLQLQWLIALRVVQGLAGGTLLVAGQAALFYGFESRRQPTLQALFAIGSVVAPGTLAPALQGWLIDTRSWGWVFFSAVPLATVAMALIAHAGWPRALRPPAQRFDWLGMALIAASLGGFTYLLSQGNRWDWFEQAHIRWVAVLALASLLAPFGQQAMRKGPGVFDFTLFRTYDFTFAFIVSFVAGAALFGSAYLIPAFALSMLAFTPTDAGLLLLPSAGLFIAALLLAAWLFQVRKVAPFATVPFGILLIMLAMWMLAHVSGESGAQDMTPAILLRGLGLGFLFLSITLIAFSGLNHENLAAGIGLFNTGRQLGGLLGVAGLQTLIDHQVAVNGVVLGAHVVNGAPAVVQRLATTGTLLSGKGMGPEAGQAAITLLGRSVATQAGVIAFDTAFYAVALLFVVAAPVLVGIKVLLARRAKHASSERSLLIASNPCEGASNESIPDRPFPWRRVVHPTPPGQHGGP